MKNLKNILEQYTIISHTLGGPPEVDLIEPENIPDNYKKFRKDLEDDLNKLLSKKNIYFWISTAMIILLLCISLYVVFFFIDKPDFLKTVLSITIVPIVPLFAFLNQIKKEKDQSETIKIIVKYCDIEIVRIIIILLSGKLL
jgi:hypothetical protein